MRSAQYALEAFGIHVDNLDDLLCFVGPPLEESFQEFYHLTPSQADEAVKVYRRVYENALYPGSPQVLDKARQAGKVLMVATSKPQRMADLVLSHFGIADRFAFVGGREDSSRRTKEEVIRYVMKENGLTRTEDIVMIGDRKHDVLGAKAVGLDSVGVLYGYGSRDEFQAAGATYIVDTLKELEELLLA